MTTDEKNLRGHGVRVDRAGLAAAAATLRAHRTLLECAHCDRRGGPPYPDALRTEAARHVEDVIADIVHVVEDDYRSEETRGGS